METFSALLALCEWNRPVAGGLPQRASKTEGLEVVFVFTLQTVENKQSTSRWFGPLWRPITLSCIPHITVYPKKYAHGFCFAVLCCGYTSTDFPISIRLTSLALWQSNDCPSASKTTLMNMDRYFMWIHYERLHNHNKAEHNKPVCIFLGI